MDQRRQFAAAVVLVDFEATVGILVCGGISDPFSPARSSCERYVLYIFPA